MWRFEPGAYSNAVMAPPELPELPDHSWVAVYDGHGGKLAAQLAGGVGGEEAGVRAQFLSREGALLALLLRRGGCARRRRVRGRALRRRGASR